MATDTITIRCSCGETFEEPVDGINCRPFTEFNTGKHGICPVPKDIASQIKLQVKIPAKKWDEDRRDWVSTNVKRVR